MNAIIPTTKLHLNKREMTFLVPLYITGTVALISVLIAFLFWRSGSAPGTAEWIEGSQYNPGIAYSLPGFLVYLGVQSIATTFPFGLTLGATRRAFVGGTLVWAAITSAYLTLVLALLTAIELATDHWFVGFYIFDVTVLGAGDFGILIPTVFLGTLAMLTIGGVFGASWVRFGARGPQAIATGIAIVLIVALLIAIPSATTILGAFELWWLAVAATVAIALSAVGSWTLLRTATVR